LYAKKTAGTQVRLRPHRKGLFTLPYSHFFSTFVSVTLQFLARP
jgi:hypothetical protein